MSLEGASLVDQLLKNLPAMWETWVRSLGWEDPLEKGKATHSSTLAWRIPYSPWGRKESDMTEQLSLSHLEGGRQLRRQPCSPLYHQFCQHASLVFTGDGFRSGVQEISTILESPVIPTLDFPCGSTGKESASDVRDLDLIPGLGRYPVEGKSYPLQYSGLENSIQSMGSQRVRHN